MARPNNVTLQDGNLISGVGHKDILKVFIVETPHESCDLDDKGTCGNNRRGIDGLNENLHNYFLTIFARGGVSTLLLFIYLFYYLLSNVTGSNRTELSIILFCVFFVSSFDSSMENAHFPLIFYLFIGNKFFNNISYFPKIKLEYKYEKSFCNGSYWSRWFLFI